MIRAYRGNPRARGNIPTSIQTEPRPAHAAGRRQAAGGNRLSAAAPGAGRGGGSPGISGIAAPVLQTLTWRGDVSLPLFVPRGDGMRTRPTLTVQALWLVSLAAVALV
jgi:hypothetical protein